MAPTKRHTKRPDAVRVARRGMVLYMLASRAIFEGEPDESQANIYRANLLRKVEELQLQSELEPREREILLAEIGSLDQQTRSNCAWRYEGAAVLGWILNLGCRSARKR